MANGASCATGEGQEMVKLIFLPLRKDGKEMWRYSPFWDNGLALCKSRKSGGKEHTFLMVYEVRRNKILEWTWMKKIRGDQPILLHLSARNIDLSHRPEIQWL